ncbi:MAG: metallophosphoesterase family protein [Myxococcales bacterium]
MLFPPGWAIAAALAAALPARGSVGPGGGRLPALVFAVVGDSRPPAPDDVAHYPAQVIGQIYREIDALSPRPQFVVSTGDYLFADARAPLSRSQAPRQADIYYRATRAFRGQLFPALGNHECGNTVASNCCPGCSDGLTANYQTFLALLGRLGLPHERPYYAVRFAGSDPSRPWTAKLVLAAPNAWDDEQARWLEQTLAAPTTYTFVARHEPDYDDAVCPGCAPCDAIIERHPYTLLLAGHEHTFRLVRASHEIVVGLGGAPFSSPADRPGYVVCTQRADGAIACQEHDMGSGSPGYADSAMAVAPDGKIVP